MNHCFSFGGVWNCYFLMVGVGDHYSFWWHGGFTTLPYGGVGESLLFLMVGSGWGNHYSSLWQGGGITTLPYGGVHVGKSLLFLMVGWENHYSSFWWGGGITTFPYDGVGESLLFLLVGWGNHYFSLWWGPGGGITTLPYGGVQVAGKLIAHCKIPMHKISCRGKASCGLQ